MMSYDMIPQKWIFGCIDCGCMFTINAKNQENKCPLCKSRKYDKIEGFNYSSI